MGTRTTVRWGAWAASAVLIAVLGGCGSPLTGAPADTAAAAPTRSSPVATPTSTSPTTPTTSPSTTQTTPPPTSAPATSTPPATSSPTAPATSSPTAPATTPTKPEPPTATPTQTVKPRTDLRYGDRGERVLRLQQRLSDLGYWLGKPDGHFGGLTQQAVFALQKAAGITRDGIVGPRTMAALDAGIRPASRVGGTGVEIDLDRQLLLIVRGGSVVRILNTSTGNGERYVSRGTEKTARTPTGTFRVYRMVDALEEGELGTLYRPAYYDRGFAVHGSPSVPPWPASHGCARVTNAAMDSIWANGFMTVGTTVSVYR